MTILRVSLIACILSGGLLLGACDTTTGITAPDRPSLNGSIFGSGHRAESDSTSSTSAVPSSTETTAETTTTERNGSIFGSGH